MPDYLLTYDLHAEDQDARSAFIEEALEEQLTYVWQEIAGKTLRRLPASTLWTEADSGQITLQRLERALRKAQERYEALYFEKVAIAQIDVTHVRSDRSKQPKPQLEHARRLITCIRHQSKDSYFAY